MVGGENQIGVGLRETGGEEPMRAAADNSEELPCRGEQGDGAGSWQGKRDPGRSVREGRKNWEFVHRWERDNDGVERG